MKKNELKQKQMHNEKLQNALENLKQKEVYTNYKNDMKSLLDFVRPEHMTGGRFNAECDKVKMKYIEIAKSDLYDEYEKEILQNSVAQIFEFQLKAYLTMCYY